MNTSPTPSHPGGHRTHTILASPIGALTLTATDGILTGLYMEPPGFQPATELLGDTDDAFVAATAQLRGYFAGTRTTFDLAFVLAGTPFQRRVWAALSDIPYGTTISYGELATQIGSAGASRAVGLANGRNPLSIIVPCHRVIGADGRLTGYGGGIERKRALLTLERRSAQPTLTA